MTSQPEELLSIDHYIKKTFYKTASLMANSCKAVAILGSQPKEDCQLAWEYGRHLGLAFQVDSYCLTKLEQHHAPTYTVWSKVCLVFAVYR